MTTDRTVKSIRTFGAVFRDGFILFHSSFPFACISSKEAISRGPLIGLIATVPEAGPSRNRFGPNRNTFALYESMIVVTSQKDEWVRYLVGGT